MEKNQIKNIVEMMFMRQDVKNAVYPQILKTNWLPFNIKWLSETENGYELREFIQNKPEEALQEIAKAYQNIPSIEENHKKVHIKITGLEPDPYIINLYGKMSWQKTIQELNTNDQNRLVQIEGIIKAKTDIIGRILQIDWECLNCTNILTTQIDGIQTKIPKPKYCKQCKSSRFKINNKQLENIIYLTIEENYTDATSTEVKRIPVLLQHKLAEPEFDQKINRGATVKITGILKEHNLITNDSIYRDSKREIIANNIDFLEDEYKEITVEKEDEKKIKNLLKDKKDTVEYLGNEMFKSVHGYTEVKQAMILQLIGADKVKKGGKIVRGSIHCLLLGDPGVGKSTFLKIGQELALKSRYASGKSSSAVGITAAVSKDENLGIWMVEAGAFPLAHKGILFLDEFDKINEEDRSALHEGLEAQTISVNKANVHTTLISETSLLAAANPKDGRFDTYKDLYEQFDLTPTLVSRFDLIFIFKDTPDKELDSEVANKIIQMHTSESEEDKSEWNVELFKKYLITAKKINPIITANSMGKIKDLYMKIRNKITDTERIKNIPISPRQLESAIRLSKAHARARLSEKVEEQDIEKAINLIQYTLGKVSVDFITGEIDTDAIETGKTAGTRLLNDSILKLLNHEDLTALEDIYNAHPNIEHDKIDIMIEKLKREGLIYEPRYGRLLKIK